jgi:hypothetical protein
MMRVNVESRIDVVASADRVWELLCNAKLPLTAPCCFKIGVPTPRNCTLVSETGGVGAHRQCRTGNGVINQRITEWVPPYKLSFMVESDTLGLEKHIRSMNDTFTIESISGGIRLSRRTAFETHGFLSIPKSCVMKQSVRHIHRYVMRNFKVLAEAA